MKIPLRGKCDPIFFVLILVATAFSWAPDTASAEIEITQKSLDKPLANEKSVPSFVIERPFTLAQKVADKVRVKTDQRNMTRARPVHIDFSVLQTAVDKVADSGTSQLMQIAFFDDVSLLAEITNVVPTSSGGYAFTGQIPGILHSTVVLVNNNGVVAMSVSTLLKEYSIHGSVESGYVATELDELNLAEHASPPILVNAPPLSKSPPQTAMDVLTAADTGPEIDVMVVYTPTVRANNGGVAQLHAIIDAQVAFINTIYANSGVVQRLRLVYKGEVPYTEISYSTDLARLRNPNDGFMDTVEVLRDVYRADFVSLWGTYPTACGQGYVMATESSGFESSAYNVVNSPNCTTAVSNTFAHELGHNMGLHHDNFVTMDTPITNVTPEGGGAAVNIAYAHGYVDIVNRFITVMAYMDQCNATGPMTSCTRIRHFSNPNVLYNSASTGNAANAHAARALNDTLDTTRNFRASLPASAFTGPGILITNASTYSVAEGGGSVQLTVERHVGFTGAISVNYATSNGTATAGADFTTTSGTLNWASNDATSRTIVLPILQDALLEGKEMFTVNLSNPGGGVSIGALNGTTTSATVTIIDDEPDTFPIGGVIPAGYVTPASSSAAWTVDLTDGYLSPNSLKSAAVLGTDTVNDNVYVNSDLEYTATFVAGSVSFAYRVSSPAASYTNLEYWVDGALVFSSVGGDTGWITRTQPITAGVHSLRWRFRNRLSFPCAFVSAPLPPNCADYAWIDSVVLPLALASSTTSLASSRNPSFVGQSVTFTSTVAGGTGTPAGSVAFRNDGNLIAGCSAVTLSAGAALCVTTGLLKGSRSITAQYAGNSSYNASTSVAFVQTVNALSLVPIVDLLFD